MVCNTANYTIAENITAFLVEKTGSLQMSYSDKFSKKDQLSLLGRYLGKGIITINPQYETVSHTRKVAYGQDYDTNRVIKFDGSIVYWND